MFNLLKSKTQQQKNFELYGTGFLSSALNEQNIVRKNTNFIFVFAGATLFVMFKDFFQSEWKSAYTGIVIVALSYLFLGLLAKIYMSRISSILMAVISGAMIALFWHFSIFGVIVVLFLLLLLASLRCVYATFAYHKSQHAENV